MKIIISPAKQMKIIDDVDIPTTTPIFIHEAQKLLNHIKKLNYDELKSYLKCSDTIAKKTFTQYQDMDLNRNTSPAIFSYSGIQYQYMAPHVFTDDQLQYVQSHLYIVSGFYGLLKPLDAIVPYRLEMQTKCPFSLYEYWNHQISDQIQEPILNLASEEYAKVIRKYKPVMDVKFLDVDNKEKGVYAKMARGAMVRYLAENQIQNIEDIITFDDLNYTFDPIQSTDTIYIFKQNEASL